jgi:hypothetical protein
MERVTFRRPDVKALLSTMVCMKIDAGGDTTPALARKFGVSGFPTLVLLGPTGEVLYKDSGAPRPDDFAIFFAIDPYNRAVNAYNRKDYAKVAPHAFFVNKWFGDTDLGRKMRKIHEGIATNRKYAAAYAEAKKKHEDRLAKAREVIERRRKENLALLAEQQKRARKENERRARAKEALAKADALYKKYMRMSAFKEYRKIILEFPDLYEADRARYILGKHKQKWKEPEDK